MSRAGTGRELTQWMDDAQHALTEWCEQRTEALTIDTLRALAAIPHRPHRHAADRYTFWTEEYERVMKAQLRDTIPLAGGLDAMQAWRARQDARQIQMESVLDAHAECLVAAAVPVITPSVCVARLVAPSKRRRTTADAYLDAIEVAA